MRDFVAAVWGGLCAVIPEGAKFVWSGACAVVGAVFSHVLSWGGPIEALLWAMAIDYVSGLLAAYSNPDKVLDSRKGFRGICKKLLILCLVALAHIIDKEAGVDMCSTLVVWFFLGNEGLSIIENAGNAGVPIPQKLRDTLGQITQRESVPPEETGKKTNGGMTK